MNKYYVYIFLLAITVFSCQNDASSKKETTVQPASSSEMNYPPLPEEDLLNLYKNTIAVDVIAYDLGISMSYNDAASIRPIMAMLKPAQASEKASCKSIGRISFMYASGLGEEAEMMIHNGCQSFVWLKDGKKAYMNQLTDDGHQFFTRFMPEGGKQIQLPEGAKAVPKN